MGSYTTIVVGTDGSDTSLRAVDRAGAIAQDSNARQLVIVTAYTPAGKSEVQAAQDALKNDAYRVVGSAPAEDMLREAAGRARRAGAPTVTTLAREGAPIAVLDQAIAELDADLVVVGNVGLNTLAGRILGSVPQGVARRAGVDVLIVHTT
jgi:nucleotide-binding universal stress UspA family protein